MKKLIPILTIVAIGLFSALPSNAQTNAPAATNASAAPAPAPTLEQRVSGLEAYINNGDPQASLKTGPKDKDGNATIPDGLTTPTVGVPGPGHNAWQMTS